jgi:cyclopropane-fatty-acyl-phospholipid synthase
MDANTRRRVRTSPRYRYPARWEEPLITGLFETSINRGRIGLQFEDEIVEVGSGPYICTIAPPTLPRFLALLAKPDYRLPNYFTKGYWCCERGKLYDFLELLTTQEHSLFHGWFRLFNASPIRDGVVYKLFPLKVKENIAKHYNTSPDFMKLILGDRLEYTCAFFDENHTTLASAQQNKIDLIVSRLGASPEHNILDLGCGWGQIAEAVAAKSGARVTGVSLSSEQIQHAQRQCSSDRLNFIAADYEALEAGGLYDRIYSVGMLEHVGRGLLSGYFERIAALLAVDGRALVHCIVRKRHQSTNSWIDKEVFPGAYIPQLSEVIEDVERSRLEVVQIFAHDRSNYFQTLRAWAENFYANERELEGVLANLVDTNDADTIMRLWEFYLYASRLSFNTSNGNCYNVQIVLRRIR